MLGVFSLPLEQRCRSAARCDFQVQADSCPAPCFGAPAHVCFSRVGRPGSSALDDSEGLRSPRSASAAGEDFAAFGRSVLSEGGAVLGRGVLSAALRACPTVLSTSWDLGIRNSSVANSTWIVRLDAVGAVACLSRFILNHRRRDRLVGLIRRGRPGSRRFEQLPRNRAMTDRNGEFTPAALGKSRPQQGRASPIPGLRGGMRRPLVCLRRPAGHDPHGRLAASLAGTGPPAH